MPAKKPNYGIDAPGVIGILALVAVLGLVLFASVTTGMWAGNIGIFQVGGMGLGFAIVCGTTAMLMMYSSKIGKIRGRDKLLNLLPWRGDEQVLDVGCGRGLLLIAAAKRLKSGRAHGVDIWQAQDLSGNRPEATLDNARLEGVADRIEIHTADMREIPFPNGTFDLIVSSWAVHNLYEAKDREKALKQIARVLKPGGRLLLRDIKHGAEYVAVLTSAGLTEIQRVDNRALSLLATLWTFGGVRPIVLIACKLAS